MGLRIFFNEMQREIELKLVAWKSLKWECDIYRFIESEQMNLVSNSDKYRFIESGR